MKKLLTCMTVAAAIMMISATSYAAGSYDIGNNAASFSAAEQILLNLQNSYPELKVVLTLGEKGCVYMDKNSRYYQPIFKTEVVDTTAACDTFTGYFISEISKGTQYKDAIKIASCASAVTVSGKGAAPSIPTEEEVRKALNYLREEQ